MGLARRGRLARRHRPHLTPDAPNAGPTPDEIRAHALAEHPDAIVAATVAELDRRRDVMRRLADRAEDAEDRLRAFTDAAQAVLDAVPAQGTLV